MEQKGTDVKIFRAIAQNPSNELTVEEIIKITGSKNNSIYRNIHALASQSGEVWDARYLFCSTLINDLFNKMNNDDIEEIDRMCAKGRLDEEIDKITLKLESFYYDNDSERVKLVPHIESNDAEPKDIIIFENNRRIHAKIILNKSAEKTKDSAVLIIGDRNIPLIPIYKGHKLYFRSLRSVFKVKGELDYLRCMTSNTGISKVVEYKKKITKISNSKYILDEKKDRLTNNYLSKIRKIYDNVRYRKLSMTTKSLLLYASKENDYAEFNKSIECLSNCDADLIEEKVVVKDFDEFGEEHSAVYHPFIFKRDFPYLSKYAIAKNHLPPNFVIRLLKKIALELRDKLQDMNGEEINYAVANRILEHVRKCIPDDRSINKNKIKHINNYLGEIGEYIRYIDLRNNEAGKQKENWKNIHDREKDLHKTLLRHIENGVNENEEVITIYEQIRCARVLWDSERHILELTEKKYGGKYIVTPTCLIRKSKARKLRALLRGKPTPRKANSLLMENGGIPEECLNYGFLTKLGFCIDVERPNYANPFVTEIKRNRSTRKWKL